MDDYPSTVRMLERDRIDAIYGSFQSLAYNAILQGHEPAKLFGEGLPFIQLDLQLACVPDELESSAVEKLREALDDLIETGIISEIGKRYMVSSETSAVN